ncbi:hypothetical protein LINPERPRIM_LOCUS23356 [Linum perenne]
MLLFCWCRNLILRTVQLGIA